MAHLAGARGVPVLMAVRHLGFRQHAVVDRITGQHVGDLPLPGLWVDFGEFEVIVFCQVTVIPAARDYRPDFLCVLRHGRRMRWFAVEIDGVEKDLDDYQSRRAAELALPLLRFKPGQLTRNDFLVHFRRELEACVLMPLQAEPFSQPLRD